MSIKSTKTSFTKNCHLYTLIITSFGGLAKKRHQKIPLGNLLVYLQCCWMYQTSKYLSSSLVSSCKTTWSALLLGHSLASCLTSLVIIMIPILAYRAYRAYNLDHAIILDDAFNDGHVNYSGAKKAQATCSFLQLFLGLVLLFGANNFSIWHFLMLYLVLIWRLKCYPLIPAMKYPIFLFLVSWGQFLSTPKNTQMQDFISKNCHPPWSYTDNLCQTFHLSHANQVTLSSTSLANNFQASSNASGDDPSAAWPTETLLQLLLPPSTQVFEFSKATVEMKNLKRALCLR